MDDNLTFDALESMLDGMLIEAENLNIKEQGDRHDILQLGMQTLKMNAVILVMPGVVAEENLKEQRDAFEKDVSEFLEAACSQQCCPQCSMWISELGVLRPCVLRGRVVGDEAKAIIDHMKHEAVVKYIVHEQEDIGTKDPTVVAAVADHEDFFCAARAMPAAYVA